METRDLPFIHSIRMNNPTGPELYTEVVLDHSKFTMSVDDQMCRCLSGSFTASVCDYECHPPLRVVYLRRDCVYAGELEASGDGPYRFRYTEPRPPSPIPRSARSYFDELNVLQAAVLRTLPQFRDRPLDSLVEIDDCILDAECLGLRVHLIKSQDASRMSAPQLIDAIATLQGPI